MPAKSWRSNPEIMAAGDFCKRFGRKAAVILSFLPDGRYSIVSYGKDGKLCAAAGAVNRRINELIQSGEIEVERLG